MRESILSKIKNVSAKQFNKILSSDERIFLSTIGVEPESTNTKTLGKQVACLVLDITDKKCTVCSGSIPYVDFKEYIKRQYCCFECRKKDVLSININASKALRGNKEVVEKRKLTFKSRYGADNAMRISNVKSERVSKSQEKYGVDHPSQVEEIKKKRSDTNLERYGVTNYLVKYNKDQEKHPKLCINYQSLQNLKYITPLFTLDEYKGIVSGGRAVNYKFRCNECHTTFTKNIASWNDVEDCVVCNRKTNSYESLIESFLVRYNIRFIKHDRNTLNGQEIDFLLPDLKIGIEIDGLYYHSSRFINDKNYHINKTRECLDRGIQLIHIFGDEFFKPRALMTRLRAILKVHRYRIGARKCEVRRIDTSVKSKFLDKYHLQGDIASSINYGLFFKKRLVSVMTFGGLRKCVNSKPANGSYELYRYCTINNMNIAGGASKLFKAFIREFDPVDVISYADMRYTTHLNSVYSKIGMDVVHETGPNYWVVIGNKRCHRFGFRKSVLKNKLELFDEALTEHENLRNNNIYIIFDCGNLKYKYNHKKVGYNV